MTTLELIKSDFKARGVNPTFSRIIFVHYLVIVLNH